MRDGDQRNTVWHVETFYALGGGQPIRMTCACPRGEDHETAAKRQLPEPTDLRRRPIPRTVFPWQVEPWSTASRPSDVEPATPVGSAVAPSSPPTSDVVEPASPTRDAMPTSPRLHL
ncbi:hypothetical protein [Curtobacterium ammoniigenes]|uniref:hypothetical protein n=1 Tax=Curtobacterium ammoniigenes TaxID=395387 RepID=UPI00082F5671|nr:hypothetical protein [Curtobacterium ammoniigenes]